MKAGLVILLYFALGLRTSWVLEESTREHRYRKVIAWGALLLWMVLTLAVFRLVEGLW